MARCTVTLAHADAAAPEAATQIWDTLNSLAAATDGVLSGVEARVASDRGTWPPRQRVFQRVFHARLARVRVLTLALLASQAAWLR
jgi:hypothetical protein